MRDAVAAIEAAVKELVEARDALPAEFAVEIDTVIAQTRTLLDSLVTRSPDPMGGPSADEDGDAAAY